MDTHNLNAYQYRMTQLLQAQIEMEGMKATNEACKIDGVGPIYQKQAFEELIEKYGVHHNAAVEAGWKITE